MDRIKIDTWANTSKDSWNAILLGNGASIAIHKEFAYPTLHGVADAKGLLPTTAPLFAKLGTTDFRACAARVLVCQACQRGLGDTVGRYLLKGVRGNARSALIEAGRRRTSSTCQCRIRSQKGGRICKLFPNCSQPELRPHAVLGHATVQ